VNQQAGKPLFGDGPSGVQPLKIRKIAFVSPHCIIDYYNGASIATLQALQLLQTLGFECQAFCGSQLDAPRETSIDDLLARQPSPYEARSAKIDTYEARMIFILSKNVPITIFGSVSTRGDWLDEAEYAAFFTAYTKFLDAYQPDAIISYGGSQAAKNMMMLAKKRDIPVIFALHNCLYSSPDNFAWADYATVPSDFCRQFYWNNLRLACHKLPYVINHERVTVANHQPNFVTFVNPDPNKGVSVFATIAKSLAEVRPDIPLLVVESRGQADLLAQCGLDLRGLPNIHWMKATPDPRDFYRITKYLLMPSLWNEAFGLIAAEAMLNGIPVVGSTRGGIPEVVGSGGILIDIPASYMPQSREIPSVEEVAPWIEAIVCLWDDERYYLQLSAAARHEAQRWHVDRIAPLYRDFFSNLCHQPASPLVPSDYRASSGLKTMSDGK
jgi:glycosyltransferase involved in cell wall biosynthesis